MFPLNGTNLLCLAGVARRCQLRRQMRSNSTVQHQPVHNFRGKLPMQRQEVFPMRVYRGSPSPFVLPRRHTSRSTSPRRAYGTPCSSAHYPTCLTSHLCIRFSNSNQLFCFFGCLLAYLCQLCGCQLAEIAAVSLVARVVRRITSVLYAR